MNAQTIMNILRHLPPDEQVAITFFLKDEADEQIAEDGHEPLTNAEWEKVAMKYSRDELIDQYATEAFRDYIYDVVGERDKSVKNKQTVS